MGSLNPLHIFEKKYGGKPAYPSGGITGIVPLAEGGTGSALSDPGADRILFWDDSAGAVTWLTAGSNLTITGTTLDATGGSSFTWNEVTGTSASAAVQNGYIANNAGLVTITLPATAVLGSVIEICGKGAGGWALAQNASQLVHFGVTTTTTGTGGSLASTNQYDTLRILCTVADTTWTVLSVQGTLTVV